MFVKKLALFLSLCFLPNLYAQIDTGPGVEGDYRPIPRGGSAELFSTLDGILSPAWSIPSQLFSNLGPNFPETVGADDFTIDNSVNGWQIEAIRVAGIYSSAGPQAGPAESINIYILENNGVTNLPNTANLDDALYMALEQPYTDLNEADFLVDLPGGGVFLLPGTYWLVVQSVQDSVAAGNWFWTESALIPDTGQTHGFESAWMQNLEIVGTACVDAWGRRITDCDVTRPSDPTLPERDLAFAIDGEPVVNVVAGTPNTTLLSEDGSTSSFSVVLASSPSSPVTVSLNISDPGEAQISAIDGIASDLDLVFDSGNWNTPQTVTVTALDDLVNDGDRSFSVSFQPVASADPNFAGLMLPSYNFINQDNECINPEVTKLAGASFNPSFSADGGYIAFVSDSNATGMNADGNFELFLYDVVANTYSQLTQTSSGNVSSASISDDGSLIAFISSAGLVGPGGSPEVYLYDGTTPFIQLTSGFTPGSVNVPLDISGDGTHVAYLSASDPVAENPDGSVEAFLVEVAGLTTTQISDDAGDNPAFDAEGVSVNGDGTRLGFIKNLGVHTLFLHDTSGTTTTIDTATTMSYPSISNNGLTLAYTSNGDPEGTNADGNDEAFVYKGLDLMNGSITQVTQTTGSGAGQTALSANGNRAAFISPEDLVGGNPLLLNQVFTYRCDMGSLLQATDLKQASTLSSASLSSELPRVVFALEQAGNSALAMASQKDDIINLVVSWPELNILGLLNPGCE